MKTISLDVREGIDLEDLQQALATLVTEQGCPGCGLNGFDIRFGIDPAFRLREQMMKFDFVRDVQVLPVDFAMGPMGLPGLR